MGGFFLLNKFIIFMQMMINLVLSLMISLLPFIIQNKEIKKSKREHDIYSYFICK
jgi:hypothetical protein